MSHTNHNAGSCNSFIKRMVNSKPDLSRARQPYKEPAIGCYANLSLGPISWTDKTSPPSSDVKCSDPVIQPGGQ